jgi:aconitate decarboxylase
MVSALHPDAANSEPPSVTSQLCEWISATTLENIPPSVIERAKHLILDGIACGLVGARVPWSKAAFDAISQFEAPGSHVIIGYKEVHYPNAKLSSITVPSRSAPAPAPTPAPANPPLLSASVPSPPPC